MGKLEPSSDMVVGYNVCLRSRKDQSVGGTSGVKCQHMVYNLCQDILYTLYWLLFLVSWRWPPPVVVVFTRFASSTEGTVLLSPEGATGNSQGRKPLEFQELSL